MLGFISNFYCVGDVVKIFRVAWFEKNYGTCWLMKQESSWKKGSQMPLEESSQLRG